MKKALLSLAFIASVAIFAPAPADAAMEGTVVPREGIHTGYTRRFDSLRDIYRAIRLRNQLHNNKLNEDKHILRSLERHKLNMDANATNQVQTHMTREGELTDYEAKRVMETHQYNRHNAKAVWRQRVLKYYFEGSHANGDELNDNLLFGSTHRVNPFQNSIPIEVLKAQAKTNHAIRQENRSLQDEVRVPTGYQAKSKDMGEGRDYYRHNWMMRTDGTPSALDRYGE